MSVPESHEPSNLVDELSAYLDGELDNEASQRIEALLATDAHARDELHRLERAWQALNRLSSVEVSPSFTQTTVAMIAVSNLDGPVNSKIARAKRHLSGWLTAAAALLAIGGVGYGIMTAADPHTNQRLLQDLPVIENVDLYQPIGDIQFLRSLHKSGAFADKNDKKPKPPATSVPAVAASLSERRTKVEQLNQEQKSDLLNKQERFDSMTPAEQQQMRDLHTALQSDPQAADLRRTQSRYHDWLANLNVSDRVELQQVSLDARVDKIVELRKASEGQNNPLLTNHDLAVVQQWIEKRIQGNLPPEKRQQLEKLPDADRRRAIFREVWQRWQVNEPSRWMGQLTDQDIQDLGAQLSPPNRQRLLATSGGPQKLLLLNWVRQALSPYFNFGGKEGAARLTNVSPESLMRFFEKELSEDERAKMFALPANEFQNKLRRQYYLIHGPQPGQPLPGDGHGPPLKQKRSEGRPFGTGDERRPPRPNGDRPFNEERPFKGERPFGDRPGGGPRPPKGEQPLPPDEVELP